MHVNDNKTANTGVVDNPTKKKKNKKKKKTDTRGRGREEGREGGGEEGRCITNTVCTFCKKKRNNSWLSVVDVVVAAASEKLAVRCCECKMEYCD